MSSAMHFEALVPLATCGASFTAAGCARHIFLTANLVKGALAQLSSEAHAAGCVATRNLPASKRRIGRNVQK